MSPATCTLPPPVMETDPFDTRSPTTARVPPPLTTTALPVAPPQPAWLSAVRVGAYRRLLTLPVADDPIVGMAPLVRMRANCSGNARDAAMANRLPPGPIELTACVSTVPSE